MISGGKTRVVLVTCGSLAEGRKIARGVVKKRLAACVNVGTTPMESIYWWKGKVEKAKEFLLVMKTSTGRLKELEEAVRRLHSYDVPEFIVLQVRSGSREYLRWIQEATN